MRIFRRRRGAEHGPEPESQAESRLSAAGQVFTDVRHALRPIGRRRLAAAIIAVALPATLGMFIIAGFSMWWTSQPSFCGRCHPMKPFISAWKESPHRDVNCERCHTNPGLFGFVGGKIAGLQVVMNYVRGRYEDWSFNAVVANAACLECHERILTKNIHVTRKVELVVSHKNIVGSGSKCITCHSTIAHGDAVPIGSRTNPAMSTCFRCHNDVVAPLRCNLCHPGRSAAGAHEPASTPAAAARGGG